MTLSTVDQQRQAQAEVVVLRDCVVKTEHVVSAAEAAAACGKLGQRLASTLATTSR
jgi:hypothetical protein